MFYIESGLCIDYVRGNENENEGACMDGQRADLVKRI